MWRSRMFWRLFGAYGLLLVTAILIIGMVIDDHVEHYAEHQLELNLRNVAFLTEHAVRNRKSSEGPLSQAWIEALRGDLKVRISLLAGDGHALADSESEFPQAENLGTTPEVHQAMTDGFG